MPVTRGFGIVGTGVIAAIHADAIALLARTPGWWRSPTWPPGPPRRSPPRAAARPSPISTRCSPAATSTWCACACRAACTPRSASARRKAGKHLVVEKPIDVSLAAADRLIEAARAAGRGADGDLPAPLRPGPGRAEAPDRRRCAGPPGARRGQHQVVPQPGVLRQRGLARHLGDGRRLADEPGRPLRRPAPLVPRAGRRGHRGLHHPGAPDRGRGHRAGHRQVRLGRRRHDLVEHRRLPRLPAAPGDHRDRRAP